MKVEIKPKHLVLQEFSAVLLRHNLMMFSCDNPLEYEEEALSILSRYSESALHLANDENLMNSVAVDIVKQSFDFWFNTIDNVNVEPIAKELVAVFRASFGVFDEQETNT